ncbi:MAG TPA: rhamnulokinase family protein [Jatrophihabitantaceae bacterium]
MSGDVRAFAAVDLGASSGRVLLGRVGPDTLDVEEVHRFANQPVTVRGTLHWDILGLYRETLLGLRRAADRAELTSIGVDSWAVDYGLLDDAGALMGNPVHYRDARTAGAVERVLARVPAADLYATTGIQLMPINTLIQLAADRRATSACCLLLIPDLLGYWLTGRVGAEFTNASTTQLLDVRTGEWATELAGRMGLDPSLLPPLRRPGDVLGPAGELGGVPVVAVGSHDTASAVVGVPATTDRFAYISCGTWALVGVELREPVLTEASRQANFTNEAGVDGTIRYLRNVMGLWLLQECERTWDGTEADRTAWLSSAADQSPFRSIIDVDDPAFAPPGDMPARIADHCVRTGQPVPRTPSEFVRCIVDSLALAFRATLDEATRLSGATADVVHLVGGGARNALLAQLTADACGRPVVAGPAEAAALGNLLVQAQAAGVLDGGLDAMRALIVRTQSLERYEPRGDDAAWRLAAKHLADLRTTPG